MARVMRLSSMVESQPCVIMIDNQVKYFPVHGGRRKKSVKLRGKCYHEEDLPMGVEVII